MFNGRNPIDKIDIQKYYVISEETSKDVISTVSRGIIGKALFGIGGTSAALTGKENKVYTIKIVWDKYVWKNIRDDSIFELDFDFYKTFMETCVRTPEDQAEFERTRNSPPSKIAYNYEEWLKDYGFTRTDEQADIVFTNMILDKTIPEKYAYPNPEYEEYIKKQNKSKDNTQNINNDDITAKLKKLKSLFEEQLITEEEYTTKKQEILNML